MLPLLLRSATCTPYAFALLLFKSMFGRTAMWQEARVMCMCQQQLMGGCQQLKVWCSQNCASRGVGACLVPDLCRLCDWLCMCNVVGLGLRHCTCASCRLAMQVQCCAPNLGHCREARRSSYFSVVIAGASKAAIQSLRCCTCVSPQLAMQVHFVSLGTDSAPVGPLNCLCKCEPGH